MPWLALGWLLAELTLALVVWFRVAKPNGVPGRVAGWLLLGSAVMVVPVRLVQGFLLESLQLDPVVADQGAWGALLAAMAVLAPVQQAALVLVVWPVHRSSHLLHTRAAVAAAILVSLGFCCVDGGWMLLTTSQPSILLRALVRTLHTAGACILWVAAASYDQNKRKHWFALAWLAAVLVQGFGDHVALGRGPGFGILSLPLLLVLAVGTASLLRTGAGGRAPFDSGDLTAVEEEPRPAGALWAAKRLSRVSFLPERPTIHQIRIAWQHQHRPALLHWIVAGALIYLGALFVSVALAVVASRWLAVDLSRIEDNEFSATGPLLFLGTFVIAAFPISGYLVAVASAADSVFEPGMGALVAIVIVLALLAVAAPVSVVFALAIAPLAFGLACVGAWFGLRRAPEG